MKLVHQNSIKLQIDKIFLNEVNRNVAQGSPLALLLFNVSINFVVKELSSFDVTNAFGFKISGISPTSILANTGFCR